MSTTDNYIINAVCDYYNISSDDLLSKSRFKTFAIPRHMEIFLLREIGGAFYRDIAKLFNRHHATITASHSYIAGLLDINHKRTVREVAELTEIIRSL